MPRLCGGETSALVCHLEPLRSIGAGFLPEATAVCFGAPGCHNTNRLPFPPCTPSNALSGTSLYITGERERDISQCEIIPKTTPPFSQLPRPSYTALKGLTPECPDRVCPEAETKLSSVCNRGLAGEASAQAPDCSVFLQEQGLCFIVCPSTAHH